MIRVVLLGDSIRQHYQPLVAQLLERNLHGLGAAGKLRLCQMDAVCASVLARAAGLRRRNPLEQRPS